MRVISGKAKGTKLANLKGARVRPTLDRVKETLFNLLGQRLEDVVFLDLFAGSGSLGIEALSRGAKKAVFVEPDPKAQQLILANLEKCRFVNSPSPEEGWELLKTDAFQALSLLADRGERFDLVHVDPPYDADLYEKTLLALSGSGLIGESSTVVAEHFHKTVLKQNYDRLNRESERKVGDTCLSIYSFEALTNG
ncbi:MAG: 16S rRNA (guanine(966)-N(2))-methyltransferase RsmD [Nitrospinaceae bacterium]